MNLYLVLTIALGAISTLVDAPVPQPVQLVVRESRRQQRQARVATVVRIPRPARVWWCSPQPQSRAPRPYGTGSPRAPAVG